MAAGLEVPSVFSQGPLALSSDISIIIASLLLRCVQQSLALSVTRIHSIPFQVEMLRQIPNHCSQLTGLHLNKRDLITAFYAVDQRQIDVSLFRTESKELLKPMTLLRNTLQ